MRSRHPQSFPCPRCPELALGCDSQAAEVPGPQGWMDDRSSPVLSEPAQLDDASVSVAREARPRGAVGGVVLHSG